MMILYWRIFKKDHHLLDKLCKKSDQIIESMSFLLLVFNGSFLQGKTINMKVIGNLLNNSWQKDKGNNDDSHEEGPKYIYLTLL